MRKILPFFLAVASACILITLYTLYDNNRVVVVYQEIAIDDLPDAFDGFKILQVSDLHGKEFGDQQRNLAGVINSLDYDVIAFTGDFQAEQDNAKPFLDLLHAIDKKTTMIFIGGNSGPFDSDLFTGSISPDGRMLQEEGCTLLERPILIERNGARLWFSELYFSMQPEALIAEARDQMASAHNGTWFKDYLDRTIAFQEEMKRVFSAISAKDTLIGVTHYPLSKQVLDGSGGEMHPYDLVIAGHYHGGQIRLPILGALYIPDHTSQRNGFLPDQRMVDGLYKGTMIQQYISRGLGASDAIPFLQFRLCNSPEVNLLTLHRSGQ